MRFGIFDHLDDSGLPLSRHFEERLRLIEAYDRLGFYAYHLAEHHNTPLGYAPSPSVFLSAVAQRTERLKFGPMVYLLPLYHPLRLIDEICMLDQLSHGRFLYGVGRGISPIEVGFYGINFETGMQQFREAYEAIRIGLTEDELTFHGKFYDFDHVPIVMKPMQKPWPELWYGTSRPDSIPWAAKEGANIVTLRDISAARAIIDLYKSEWQKLGRKETDLPLLGINRHLVVAESEERARDIARRGYRPWRKHMELLWAKYDVPFPLKATLPEQWDELEAHGHAIAGTPALVKDYVAKTVEAAGASYFVCDFAFGSITPDEARRSAELFAEQVMPAFA
jgi:alkanesulfonate monooxygenase SsuD/methylene tetrahydromethanopterin reductase-like flavin-dependent oxidoreductase (luciferase family)